VNAPENNPPSSEGMQTETFTKKSNRRTTIIVLVWLVVCSGVLTTVVRAIQAAREAARCSTCVFHLKQIGYGLQIFDDANGSLPPAYLCDEKGKPIHSWQTLLAPYMGHYSWRNRNGYSLKEPWDGPNNSRVLSRPFRECQCASVDVDNPSRMTVDYVAVVGPDTMWPGRDRVTLGGNKDKILLIEMPDSDYRCLEPRSPTVEEFMAKIKSPTGKGIRCIHPNGLAYLTVGGEVDRFPPDTDPETIRKLLKRDPNCKVIPAQEKIQIVEGWEQNENESK
jgi:Protein of unknown function (DUF1559)